MKNFTADSQGALGVGTPRVAQPQRESVRSRRHLSAGGQANEKRLITENISLTGRKSPPLPDRPSPGSRKINIHVNQQSLKEKGRCPSLKRRADWLQEGRAPKGRAGGYLEMVSISLLQRMRFYNKMV